ncbi:HAD-IA family hydrolase [Amycolatopsis thermophila]|uniref:HAD superfamily hydrolase (TIGR01509 family) n=1 Tax=Amycolatopsis thermophila TaxID=206084 RepID=A0ABU0EVG2_9PSEU|nr:HAD-IA family hydrolase [Amycolatopsis thermophila]MDQ0379306.1 HAD superfamily hydrolase (TIGR01509 family) [Amycolatopsis thermophila]
MLRGLVLDYAGVLTDPEAADLLDAVDTLRHRGIRTALLSNADGSRGGLARHFDALVFSGEVGIAKPDPRVFRLTAERLGLPATGCVMVDDSRANIDGATAAGMVGVHHTSVPDTLAELSALFPA